MSDLNQYACTGRLGFDPDIRAFPNGDPVVNLRLAISERWKSKDAGEKQEKTLWLSVKITNKGLCKLASDYLKKGSRVALSGKLETESWEKNGETQNKTVLALGPYNASLVMLYSKQDEAQTPSSPVSVDDDSSIPF